MSWHGFADVINHTPPSIAFYAGFMTALALRRQRIQGILDTLTRSETDD